MYADRCLVENCCITKTYLNGTRNSDEVTLPCLFDAASGERSQPQRTLVEVFLSVHVSPSLVLGQIDCV